jgi:hypothetical protein
MASLVKCWNDLNKFVSFSYRFFILTLELPWAIAPIDNIADSFDRLPAINSLFQWKRHVFSSKYGESSGSGGPL